MVVKSRNDVVRRLLERRVILDEDGNLKPAPGSFGTKAKIPPPKVSLGPKVPQNVTVTSNHVDLDGDGVLSNVVLIKWDNVPKTNFYEVMISNDGGSGKKYRTAEPHWEQIYTKRAGVWTIKVRSSDTFGNFSMWSPEVTYTAPRKITLDLDAEIFAGTDLVGRGETNDKPKARPEPKVDPNATIVGFGRF